MLSSKRFALVLWPLLTACVPDIYLIDRQTVLELEASGAWPELDQKFRGAAQTAGPSPLESTRDRVEQRQIYSMTHDDGESMAPKAAGAETKESTPKAKAQ